VLTLPFILQALASWAEPEIALKITKIADNSAAKTNVDLAIQILPLREKHA
jgi:hypothetical protein